MPDVFSTEKRSWIMSRIRSKDTKIEIKMSEILNENRIRFKRHVNISGKPDFLVDPKTAIFCDGDFWHGYNYKKGKIPEGAYWKRKIENNMNRDRRINRLLRSKGYSVLRIWEHDINHNPEKCMRKILKSINNSNRHS